jgi:hypothetical protein
MSFHQPGTEKEKWPNLYHDTHNLVTLHYSEMFKFEVPSLTVGTLDTLMVRSFAIFLGP